MVPELAVLTRPLTAPGERQIITGRYQTMFLADYHVHSSCSFDARDKMADMARAELARGVTEICFTDHVDFGDQQTMQIGPERFGLPRAQVRQFIDAMERAPEGIDIRLGLELGQGNHDPARARRIYAMPEYDFILGSLHNLRDEKDFYYLRYGSEERCLELYDRYLDELIELAGINCFDCMAHIGYCLRYMHKQGQDVELSMERFGYKIDLLLRALIENGKGIELNVADLVAGGRQDAMLRPVPGTDILRRYRELGGDIITVGSDAHNVKAAGVGIREGYELLAETGFRYVAVYKRHKPEFKRIEI